MRRWRSNKYVGEGDSWTWYDQKEEVHRTSKLFSEYKWLKALKNISLRIINHAFYLSLLWQKPPGITTKDEELKQGNNTQLSQIFNNDKKVWPLVDRYFIFKLFNILILFGIWPSWSMIYMDLYVVGVYVSRRFSRKLAVKL